jgi:hypothetical protein
MKTDKPKEYIAPEVKVVEVIVEKGFAFSATIHDRNLHNNLLLMEKHAVDEDVVEW